MARMDDMKNKKLYICTGENFGFQAGIGHCGDVHSIEKWIEILFRGREEQAKQYFEGWKPSEICKYLLKNCGKRIEIYKF